jgi:hypothetical protein
MNSLSGTFVARRTHRSHVVSKTRCLHLVSKTHCSHLVSKTRCPHEACRACDHTRGYTNDPGDRRTILSTTSSPDLIRGSLRTPGLAGILGSSPRMTVQQPNRWESQAQWQLVLYQPPERPALTEFRAVAMARRVGRRRRAKSEPHQTPLTHPSWVNINGGWY